MTVFLSQRHRDFSAIKSFSGQAKLAGFHGDAVGQHGHGERSRLQLLITTEVFNQQVSTILYVPGRGGGGGETEKHLLMK